MPHIFDVKLRDGTVTRGIRHAISGVMTLGGCTVHTDDIVALNINGTVFEPTSGPRTIDWHPLVGLGDGPDYPVRAGVSLMEGLERREERLRRACGNLPAQADDVIARREDLLFEANLLRAARCRISQLHDRELQLLALLKERRDQAPAS